MQATTLNQTLTRIRDALEKAIEDLTETYEAMTEEEQEKTDLDEVLDRLHRAMNEWQECHLQFC